MDLIKRDTCVISNTQDLEPLYTFKQFPVFMGATAQPRTEDLRADMSWSISATSGVLQLTSLLPLSVLYPASHGSGQIGATWARHHEEFAKFIHRLRPSSVFEIGGAHGILSREYSRLADAPWTILEPNPAPVEGVVARYVKGFFDSQFRFHEPCEAVVHSHLFEHTYEPDDFLRKVAGFVQPGKYHFFSVPHLQAMLERKYCNCINFEHTFFFTEALVEYLLLKHGFRIIDKEYFQDAHSIFYASVRDPYVSPTALPQGLVEEHRCLFSAYLEYHTKLVSDLNERLRRAAVPVFLFGSHVFSQYLLAFGLDASRIQAILDNDPLKQGKRLYGSALSVKSPKILAHHAQAAVILKAGAYDQEIRADIIANINPRIEFWG